MRLTIECDECHGTGGLKDDGHDPEYVSCWYCHGTGRLPALSEWWFRFRCGLKARTTDRFREWFQWTRLGTWYWRRFGLERAARERAKNCTAFELMVKHGRSLERLREFATAVEDGTNVGDWYRKECRIEKELKLACEIANGREAKEGR